MKGLFLWFVCFRSYMATEARTHLVCRSSSVRLMSASSSPTPFIKSTASPAKRWRQPATRRSSTAPKSWRSPLSQRTTWKQCARTSVLIFSKWCPYIHIPFISYLNFIRLSSVLLTRFVLLFSSRQNRLRRDSEAQERRHRAEEGWDRRGSEKHQSSPRVSRAHTSARRTARLSPSGLPSHRVL